MYLSMYCISRSFQLIAEPDFIPGTHLFPRPDLIPRLHLIPGPRIRWGPGVTWLGSRVGPPIDVYIYIYIYTNVYIHIFPAGHSLWSWLRTAAAPSTLALAEPKVVGGSSARAEDRSAKATASSVARLTRSRQKRDMNLGNKLQQQHG